MLRVVRLFGLFRLVGLVRVVRLVSVRVVDVNQSSAEVLYFGSKFRTLFLIPHTCILQFQNKNKRHVAQFCGPNLKNLCPFHK